MPGSRQTGHTAYHILLWGCSQTVCWWETLQIALTDKFTQVQKSDLSGVVRVTVFSNPHSFTAWWRTSHTITFGLCFPQLFADHTDSTVMGHCASLCEWEDENVYTILSKQSMTLAHRHTRLWAPDCQPCWELALFTADTSCEKFLLQKHGWRKSVIGKQLAPVKFKIFLQSHVGMLVDECSRGERVASGLQKYNLRTVLTFSRWTKLLPWMPDGNDDTSH